MSADPNPLRWEEAIARHRETGEPLVKIFAAEAKKDVERYFHDLMAAFGVKPDDVVREPNYEEVERIAEKMLSASAAAVALGKPDE